ncbi:hypothetical protein HZB90_04820 [archaeon]|nr:hypothetical protein [archaeon]
MSARNTIYATLALTAVVAGCSSYDRRRPFPDSGTSQGSVGAFEGYSVKVGGKLAHYSLERSPDGKMKQCALVIWPAGVKEGETHPQYLRIDDRLCDNRADEVCFRGENGEEGGEEGEYSVTELAAAGRLGTINGYLTEAAAQATPDNVDRDDRDPTRDLDNVINSIGGSDSSQDAGDAAGDVTEESPSRFSIGPDTSLNEQGIPRNLEQYVALRSMDVLREWRLENECGDTPCMFDFDFALVVAKKGWDHYFLIDYGLPDLAIRQDAQSVEDVFDRSAAIAASLLTSLEVSEVDIHQNLLYPRSAFDYFPAVEGATPNERGYVRRTVPDCRREQGSGEHDLPLPTETPDPEHSD